MIAPVIGREAPESDTSPRDSGRSAVSEIRAAIGQRVGFGEPKAADEPKCKLRARATGLVGLTHPLRAIR